MTDPEVRTRGIQALRSWMNRKKVDLTGLSKSSGVEITKLSRLLRGKIRRMSAEDAAKLEHATAGKIPAKWFGEELA